MPRSLVYLAGAGLLTAGVVLGGQKAGLWMQPDATALPSTATPMANRPDGPGPIQPSLAQQQNGAGAATQGANQNAPSAATNSRLPPTEMGGERTGANVAGPAGSGASGGPPAGGITDQPPAGTGIAPQQPARTAPPPGHVTLGAPPLPPTVERPGSTGHVNVPGSPIPASPAAPSVGPRDTPVERQQGN